MTNPSTRAFQSGATSGLVPVADAVALFVRLSRGDWLGELLNRFGYLRCWSPAITLMGMIVGHLIGRGSTLEKVLALMRSGAADGLCRSGKKLSHLLGACSSTSGYAQARSRLPLWWLRRCLRAQAEQLRTLATGWQWFGMEVRVLDGTMITLRPFGLIPRGFPRHSNQHGQCYWCQMRVLLCMCLGTGVILSLVSGSAADSEQAQTVRLLLYGCNGWPPVATATVLWMGDANFGVWRVAAASQQSGQHLLVRLTQARAQKLAGTTDLRHGLDLALNWAPSRRDTIDRGLRGTSVAGRLLVVRVERRGHRPTLFLLFTTVEDPSISALQLAALYLRRWEIELTFRHVKTQMGLGESSAKSSVMAKRELFTGVLAYNLVRGVMLLGSSRHRVALSTLSFAKAREELIYALILTAARHGGIKTRYDWGTMLLRLSKGRLPRRKKLRPNEPRYKRHRRETFPPLRGDRATARNELLLACQGEIMKS